MKQIHGNKTIDTVIIIIRVCVSIIIVIPFTLIVSPIYFLLGVVKPIDIFIPVLEKLIFNYEREETANDHPVSDALIEEHEPYFGWCDVDGCENEGCSGGNAWRDTGYWTVCYKHSADYRKGLEQPKMKQEAINREQSRDPLTGYLRKS